MTMFSSKNDCVFIKEWLCFHLRMTRFSFQNCLFLESFVFPGKEINVSRNRRTQNYFGWKVAMAIFGFILFIQGASQYNQLKRWREFILSTFVNKSTQRTCDVCRTIGGRNDGNSQQHGCNFERHQPNNTGVRSTRFWNGALVRRAPHGKTHSNIW